MGLWLGYSKKYLVLILKIVPSTNLCSFCVLQENVIKVHIIISVEVTAVHVSHHFKVKQKQIFQTTFYL